MYKISLVVEQICPLQQCFKSYANSFCWHLLSLTLSRNDRKKKIFFPYTLIEKTWAKYLQSLVKKFSSILKLWINKNSFLCVILHKWRKISRITVFYRRNLLINPMHLYFEIRLDMWNLLNWIMSYYEITTVIINITDLNIEIWEKTS